MRFDTLNALITGGAGGIGSAIAAALLRRGASVVLVDRDAAALRAAASRLKESAPRLKTLTADLTAAADTARLVDFARQNGINTLVNNAGLNHFRLLEDLTATELDAALAVNVQAPLRLCHALLPHLSRQPQAYIVNIGSVFGSIGYPGYTVYSATKFALRGFSEALRRELADTSVKVLYVAPRATRTPINAPAVEKMNRELRVAMDPPERVAKAVCTALSRERRAMVIGWPEKLFARINAIAPRVVDAAIRRQLPVIRTYAREMKPSIAPSSVDIGRKVS